MTPEELIVVLLIAARNEPNIALQMLLRDAAAYVLRLATVTNDVADTIEAFQIHGDVSGEQWAYWVAKCRAVTGNLP